MGKKQHQKDKLYLTATEWSTYYGGKKQSQKTGSRAEFRRLPFFCCSLSMQPFEHPYCTKAGVIYDIMSIVPFLKKYGINPSDGEKLSAKDLVKLSFHKNQSDKFHCPVTFKVFNENTHIVAVKQTGNVFSYDAIEQLNIKPAFWRDLLTDEAFTRKDLIEIQDPSNLDKFNLAKFYHIQKNLKVVDEDELVARKHPRYHLKAMNLETKDVLDELDRDYKAPEKEEVVFKKADKINAASYSTGLVSASFTSTSMDRVTVTDHAIIDEDIIRYERVKKKAYVKLVTNIGELNLELHSDMIPKACENFILLCDRGYYNGTSFHRSIRNFMIQGGDPLGDGKGGESAWGGTFSDHFKPNLTHTGRGILSMANSGPDTNKSQFFITYRSARYLDNKHTIFGRVVGGMDIIDKMEKVKVDKEDRPLKDITILGTQLFVNPFDEVDQQLKAEREEIALREAADRESKTKRRKKVPAVDTGPRTFKKGPLAIGKYINPAAQKRTLEADEISETAKKKKKDHSISKPSFGNFSKW